MRSRNARLAAPAIAAVVVAACGLAASPAAAKPRFQQLAGFDAPATPPHLDRVGVLKVGPKRASNILVLVPGTSAGAAYFRPLAQQIVRRRRGWQVWAVERRENLLEDHSLAARVKAGGSSGDELFDYYLGWLIDPDVSRHFEPVPDSEVGFAREWGLRVAVGDLRRVLRAARKRARVRARAKARRGNGKSRRRGRVVLGGHSLGASITTAYATWDFNGVPGSKGLAGLVFIDGGSGPSPAIGAEEATLELDELASGSPWLAFGGIPSPFMGLFSLVGSTLAIGEPRAPSTLQGFPLLPADLAAPVRVTNRSGWGFAIDPETSPPALAAAQFNVGRLAARGDPRGWDEAGEPTPLRRAARVASGWGLPRLDGTAWYHPIRLTLDARAVAAGNPNPAQRVLGVRSVHGDRLGRMPILAFGAALGGERVLDAARALAAQSRIPPRLVRLIDREATYAHNDPNAAHPRNAFVDGLLPFLRRTLPRR